MTLTTVFAPVYIDTTADTNHSSTPNLRIAYHITSLGTLSKAFSKSTKTKVELLSFKILLHLSYSKNGISGSFTFHKSKLHIIYLNLLPNSVLKDPFHHFHSMFQQFNPMPPSNFLSFIFCTLSFFPLLLQQPPHSTTICPYVCMGLLTLHICAVLFPSLSFSSYARDIQKQVSRAVV